MSSTAPEVTQWPSHIRAAASLDTIGYQHTGKAFMTDWSAGHLIGASPNIHIANSETKR